MSLKTVLEFNSDDDDDSVFEQIAEIINRRMPTAMKQRAWITLIVRNLSSDSDVYPIADGKEDPDAIDERLLIGNWDKAFEILCAHVDAAVDDIKEAIK